MDRVVLFVMPKWPTYSYYYFVLHMVDNIVISCFRIIRYMLLSLMIFLFLYWAISFETLFNFIKRCCTFQFRQDYNSFEKMKHVHKINLVIAICISHFHSVSLKCVHYFDSSFPHIQRSHLRDIMRGCTIFFQNGGAFQNSKNVIKKPPYL